MIHTHIDLHSKQLSEGIRIMLSSYTKAINKQGGRTGSLFQQNSKAKALISCGTSSRCATTSSSDYAITCFYYIHQNPLKANLVSKMEDWEFSSFKDYVGLRNGKLCNQLLAKELLDLPDNNNELYDLSYGVIEENIFEPPDFV